MQQLFLGILGLGLLALVQCYPHLGCYWKGDTAVVYRGQRFVTQVWCWIQCHSRKATYFKLGLRSKTLSDQVACYCSNKTNGRVGNQGACNRNCNGVPCGRTTSAGDPVVYLDVFTVCERGRYGTGCGLACHCANNAVCVFSTGVCSNGCATGWSGTKCDVENECVTNTDQCAQNCTDTVGGYRCACRSGYTLDSDGMRCMDNDECATKQHDCNQTCVNTVASFNCSCRQGFLLGTDGKECIDVDECTASDCHQLCTNSPGSYSCHCQDRYHLIEDGRTCLQNDTTSCPDDNDCSHGCNKTGDGYLCVCADGYTLDADMATCIKAQTRCPVDNACSHGCHTSTDGYTCVCSDGYTLESDMATCVRDHCPADFTIHANASGGFSSDCKVVLSPFDATLQQCKEEACRLAANILNYAGGQCDIRLCEELDYRLSRARGEWQVWVHQPRDQTSDLENSTPNTPLWLTVGIPVIGVIVLAGAITGGIVANKKINKKGNTSHTYENDVAAEGHVSADAQYEEVDKNEDHGKPYGALGQDSRVTTPSTYETLDLYEN